MTQLLKKKKKVQLDRNYSACKYISVCFKICLKNIYLTFGRGKLHGLRELETMWEKTDKFLAMNGRIHKANWQLAERYKHFQ